MEGFFFTKEQNSFVDTGVVTSLNSVSQVYLLNLRNIETMALEAL